jgi:hypothetical protein
VAECVDGTLQTCDETGAAYDGSGAYCGADNCATTGCIDCDDVDVSEAIRFLQVRGTHIYVYNRSGCSMNLENVVFDMAYYDEGLPGIRVDTNLLPDYPLGPGEFVALAFGQGSIGIPVDAREFDSTPTTILLCDGECSAATVFDAVQVGSGAPALPSGTTFDGEILADLEFEYLSREWRFGSENPTFLASDWVIYDE